MSFWWEERDTPCGLKIVKRKQLKGEEIEGVWIEFFSVQDEEGTWWIEAIGENVDMALDNLSKPQAVKRIRNRLRETDGEAINR